MDSADVAKRINQHGIAFDPSEDYVDALREAGAKQEVVQALVARSSTGQESGPPLTREQVICLVKLGIDGEAIARRLKARGVDFEPTDDDLETLRKVGAQPPVILAIHEVKPLSREQVGKLVVSGVPTERATALVTQRGIDFQADEEYLGTLRLAGGGDALIGALREASSKVTAELVVNTSPGAAVYLDGQFQGHVSEKGELEAKLKPGPHALKVSLKGRLDFEQTVTITPPQRTTVGARLDPDPGCPAGKHWVITSYSGYCGSS
jgi:hypothetical protein